MYQSEHFRNRLYIRLERRVSHQNCPTIRRAIWRGKRASLATGKALQDNRRVPCSRDERQRTEGVGYDVRSRKTEILMQQSVCPIALPCSPRSMPSTLKPSALADSADQQGALPIVSRAEGGASRGIGGVAYASDSCHGKSERRRHRIHPRGDDRHPARVAPRICKAPFIASQNAALACLVRGVPRSSPSDQEMPRR